MKILYYLTALLMTYFGYGLVFAEAQSYVTGTLSTGGASTVTGTVIAAPSGCVTLSGNLYIGVTDGTSGGSVTKLQNFLVAQGYFNSANLGTGRFGPLTRAAVIKFQTARELPPTGFVGPMTRAAISALGCGSNPGPTGTTAPVIYTNSPVTGKVGDTIDISGFGFTSNNTILMNGLLAQRGVGINSSTAISCTNDPNCKPGIHQTLRFTIPSALQPNCPIGSYCALYLVNVQPGVYNLSVQNENGTTAAIILIVNK